MITIKKKARVGIIRGSVAFIEATRNPGAFCEEADNLYKTQAECTTKKIKRMCRARLLDKKKRRPRTADAKDSKFTDRDLTFRNAGKIYEADVTYLMEIEMKYQ